MSHLHLVPNGEPSTPPTRERRLYLERLRRLSRFDSRARYYPLLPCIELGLRNTTSGTDEVLFIAGDHHRDIPWQLRNQLSEVLAKIEPSPSQSNQLSNYQGVFEAINPPTYEVHGWLLTAGNAEGFLARIRTHELWLRALMIACAAAVLTSILGPAFFHWVAPLTFFLSFMPAAFIFAIMPNRHMHRHLPAEPALIEDLYIGPELDSLAAPGATLQDLAHLHAEPPATYRTDFYLP